MTIVHSEQCKVQECTSHCCFFLTRILRASFYEFFSPLLWSAHSRYFTCCTKYEKDRAYSHKLPRMPEFLKISCGGGKAWAFLKSQPYFKKYFKLVLFRMNNRNKHPSGHQKYWQIFKRGMYTTLLDTHQAAVVFILILEMYVRDNNNSQLISLKERSVIQQVETPDYQQISLCCWFSSNLLLPTWMFFFSTR